MYLQHDTKDKRKPAILWESTNNSAIIHRLGHGKKCLCIPLTSPKPPQPSGKHKRQQFKQRVGSNHKSPQVLQHIWAQGQKTSQPRCGLAQKPRPTAFVFFSFNFTSLLILRFQFLERVGERRAGQPYSRYQVREGTGLTRRWAVHQQLSAWIWAMGNQSPQMFIQEPLLQLPNRPPREHEQHPKLNEDWFLSCKSIDLAWRAGRNYSLWGCWGPVTEKLQLPHPWERPRPGWPGLRAPWDSARYPCP